MSPTKKVAIGIDLGTTYSCVGVWQNDRVEILPNDQGSRTTPSVINFDGETRLVGTAAQAASQTVWDVKRLIGRTMEQLSESDLAEWPFRVSSSDGQAVVQVQHQGVLQTYTPEELSAILLTELKHTAEAYLGHSVEAAVITVPAHFNDSQRQATKDAGALAGLEVLQILNEPTAAALAYGLNLLPPDEDAKTVLVFDLGGGTFDVSLLSMEDGGVLDVRATAGDTHLGGEDLDQRLVEYVRNEIQRLHPEIELSSSAQQRLRVACEQAKRRLSSSTTTYVELELGTEEEEARILVTRAKFEDLCSDLFQTCLTTVQRVLDDAHVSRTDVDEVVLVGGSTRIPHLQQLVSDYFDGLSLCRDVHPDEAIAYGAAVQAAILSSQPSARLYDVLLLDVAPHSLGLETAGGKLSRFIARNTKIPTKKTKRFTTYEDNQSYLFLQVYEGEDPLTAHNQLLGHFRLEGIPPMPKGQPQIDVCFALDFNGVLQVTATEISTGHQQQITITSSRTSDIPQAAAALSSVVVVEEEVSPSTTPVPSGSTVTHPVVRKTPRPTTTTEKTTNTKEEDANDSDEEELWA